MGSDVQINNIELFSAIFAHFDHFSPISRGILHQKDLGRHIASLSKLVIIIVSNHEVALQGSVKFRHEITLYEAVCWPVFALEHCTSTHICLQRSFLHETKHGLRQEVVFVEKFCLHWPILAEVKSSLRAKVLQITGKLRH